MKINNLNEIFVLMLKFVSPECHHLGNLYGTHWNDFQEKDLACRLLKKAPSNNGRDMWRAPGRGVKLIRFVFWCCAIGLSAFTLG
jgi:hypothetical protein